MSASNARYAPRFLVTVDGTEFHEYNGFLTDIVVDTTTDGADHFSFVLTYPFDHEQVSFDELDWAMFEVGANVEIELGFGEGSNSTTEVFVGEIQTLNAKYPDNQPPSVHVSGYGPEKKMMDGTNARKWEEATIQTIVNDIISSYFDETSIEDADMELEHAYQDGKSDYQVVADLAEKYGYEFFGTLDTCYFRPQAENRSTGSSVATFHYGETLDDFSVRTTAAESVSTVEVRHWDENDNEEIVGSASSDSGGSGKRVYRLPVDSRAEAETIAKARLQEEQVTCTGSSLGVPEVIAGEVIEVSGIDDRFCGEYYVTTATHRFGASGYNLSFEGNKIDS